MGSAYDLVTVAAFGILVGYFVFLTDRNPRRLMHFMISAVAFAVANQVGNAALRSEGLALHVTAITLILAGVAYAVIATRD